MCGAVGCLGAGFAGVGVAGAGVAAPQALGDFLCGSCVPWALHIAGVARVAVPLPWPRGGAVVIVPLVSLVPPAFLRLS